MKKSLLSFIILLLACIAVTFVTVANAEETSDLPADTPTESSETGGDDTGASDTNTETDNKLAELIAKVNELTNEDYFTSTILPILTGAGTAIIAFLGTLAPFIKNKSKLKQLEAYAATLQKKSAEVETLLKSTNIEEIQNTLENLIGKDRVAVLDDFMKKNKIDVQQIAEVRTELGQLQASVDCLIKAAQNAWGKSTGATEALTQAPTKTMLVNLEAENAKLKNYIREQGGENTEKLIADIIA